MRHTPRPATRQANLRRLDGEVARSLHSASPRGSWPIAPGMPSLAAPLSSGGPAVAARRVRTLVSVMALPQDHERAYDQAQRDEPPLFAQCRTPARSGRMPRHLSAHAPHPRSGGRPRPSGQCRLGAALPRVRRARRRGGAGGACCPRAGPCPCPCPCGPAPPSSGPSPALPCWAPPWPLRRQARGTAWALQAVASTEASWRKRGLRWAMSVSLTSPRPGTSTPTPSPSPFSSSALTPSTPSFSLTGRAESASSPANNAQPPPIRTAPLAPTPIHTHPRAARRTRTWWRTRPWDLPGGCGPRTWPCGRGPRWRARCRAGARRCPRWPAPAGGRTPRPADGTPHCPPDPSAARSRQPPSRAIQYSQPTTIRRFVYTLALTR
jgi:hypothetical protein